MILDRINSPADLKPLTLIELNQLAGEIRSVMMQKMSVCGGHFGPNFGLVEASIALHYTFESPKDKFLFDVSHQCYIHKILTGRKEAFTNPDKYNSVNGFTNPDESEHDFFKVGHSATSISLACGMAKARDLRGAKENIIAVIGDGALSGGEAYEGLNYAGELGTNLIVIVNDNGMAMSDNHGGLYPHLKRLRESKGTDPCNIFKSLGFDYYYVDEGNSIEPLLKAFSAVKDIDHPTVVHIRTIKGKGYEIAEKAAENWHWRPPFYVENGEMRSYRTGNVGYDELTRDYFLQKMKEDPTFAVLVAAVPGSVRFYKEERTEAGKQFSDVGIAEEHAITMAAGMSRNGGKPVFVTDCTFFQRTYDQISHDLCLNNAPATLLVRNASVWGLRDVTHLGFFDIPMMSNIPNLVYLAPTNQEEYFAMLKWSIDQNKHTVAIRLPKAPLTHADYEVDVDYSNLNKAVVCKEGRKVAIIAVGDFFSIGQQTMELLKKETGIEATLINPRYITGLDTELLESLKKTHQVVVTLEDGSLDGGYGQKVASFYGDSSMKVLNFGLKKEFVDRYDANTVMKDNGLTPENIVSKIKPALDQWKSIKQFIKFGLVGLSNTAVAYVVYAACIFVGLNYFIANFLGFVISVYNAFYWSNKYVFPASEQEKRNKWLTLLKTYAAYSITGVFLNSGLLYLFIDCWHINSYLAQAICLLFTVPLNFILNKFWSFKTK